MQSGPDRYQATAEINNKNNGFEKTIIGINSSSIGHYGGLSIDVENTRLEEHNFETNNNSYYDGNNNSTDSGESDDVCNHVDFGGFTDDVDVADFTDGSSVADFGGFTDSSSVADFGGFTDGSNVADFGGFTDGSNVADFSGFTDGSSVADFSGSTDGGSVADVSEFTDDGDVADFSGFTDVCDLANFSGFTNDGDLANFSGFNDLVEAGSVKSNNISVLRSFNEQMSPGNNSEVNRSITTRERDWVRNNENSMNNRNSIRISTWNVRTLNQEGKYEEVENEMKRLNMDILGLSEVRWPGCGKTEGEETIFFHSGGDK